MSGGFVDIDLSRLPPPDVVEVPDYLALVAARKSDIVARFRARAGDELADALEATLAIEGELITKLVESGAYRQTLHYARVNDAARAVMLAFATGTDLDHKGGDFETPRMVMVPADGDTPAVMEDDARYRRRLQLSPEAFATAGARGAYIFHALSYSPQIADAWAWTPNAADGRVYVELIGFDGAPVSDEILIGLADHLMSEPVRPLTDVVVVRNAQRVDYALAVTVRLKRGPDPSVVRDEVEARVRAYAATRYRIGREVYADGITAAAMVPGVEWIDPAFNDIVCSDREIAWLSALTVTVVNV